MAIERVIFGAGCFWGVEVTFCKIKGIVNTTCGYSGGHTQSPTYADVCSGQTGHVEVVEVTYDSQKNSFVSLLDVFWHCHDPTTKDCQGADIGTQYRSVIFYFSAEQKHIAEASKREQNESGYWQAPVITEILPAKIFYPAEEYHQRYFERRGIG